MEPRATRLASAGWRGRASRSGPYAPRKKTTFPGPEATAGTSISCAPRMKGSTSGRIGRRAVVESPDSTCHGPIYVDFIRPAYGEVDFIRHAYEMSTVVPSGREHGGCRHGVWAGERVGGRACEPVAARQWPARAMAPPPTLAPKGVRCPAEPPIELRGRDRRVRAGPRSHKLREPGTLPAAPTEQRSGTSQAPGTAQGWGRWRAPG